MYISLSDPAPREEWLAPPPSRTTLISGNQPNLSLGQPFPVPYTPWPACLPSTKPTDIPGDAPKAFVPPPPLFLLFPTANEARPKNEAFGTQSGRRHKKNGAQERETKHLDVDTETPSPEPPPPIPSSAALEHRLNWGARRQKSKHLTTDGTSAKRLMLSVFSQVSSLRKSKAGPAVLQLLLCTAPVPRQPWGGGRRGIRNSRKKGNGAPSAGTRKHEMTNNAKKMGPKNHKKQTNQGRKSPSIRLSMKKGRTKKRHRAQAQTNNRSIPPFASISSLPNKEKKYTLEFRRQRKTPPEILDRRSMDGVDLSRESTKYKEERSGCSRLLLIDPPTHPSAVHIASPLHFFARQQTSVHIVPVLRYHR